MAAGGVLYLQRRATGSRPLVAPLPHRRDDLPQVAALGSEPVLKARRVLAVAHPPEPLVLHQVVQPLGEDVAGDPQPRLEVIEPRYPEKRVPDDEHAPP